MPWNPGCLDDPKITLLFVCFFWSPYIRNIYIHSYFKSYHPLECIGRKLDVFLEKLKLQSFAMLMVCKWLWKEPIRNSYTWGVIPVIPWKMVENITTELLIQTWDPGTDGIYGNHPSLMNFWYFLIFGVFFNPDQEFWAILSWFLGHFCSAFRGNSREARWGGALASWIQWLQVCPQPKNP